MNGADLYQVLYGSSSLNRKIFLLVNQAHTPFLDTVMSSITFSGSSLMLPLYLALLLVLIDRKIMPARYLAVYLAAAVLGLGVEALLKNFLHIPRPYFALGADSVRIVGRNISSFALPSGHTVFAFMTAHTLSRCRSGTWQAFLFFWATLVAWSRVYLGAHFPFDVLLGALVGIASSEAAWRLHEVAYKRYRRRGCRG